MLKYSRFKSNAFACAGFSTYIQQTKPKTYNFSFNQHLREIVAR